MTETPPLADVLGAARDAVVRELLPCLPQHLHYTARMVAHALALGQRETGPTAAMRDAARGLAAFSGHAVDERAWRGALAERIRAGAFDAPVAAQALEDALLAWVQARVALTNPRLLDANDER